MSRKRWEFDLEDGHHVVELQHGYFLGSRTVMVDGVTEKGRARAFQDQSGQYPIPLRGHTAAIWVSTDGFTYAYNLIIDGRSVSSGELSPRPPRPPVGGPLQVQVVGWGVLLMGAVMFVIAAKQGYDEYRYSVASSTTPGIVDGKSTVSGRYGPTYYLSYVFSDGARVQRRGEDYVSRATYEATRPGARFLVVYVTDDPSTNRFAGNNNLVTVAFLGPGAIAAFLYAFYLIASGKRRAAMTRRLAGEGQAVTATVTKLKSGYVRGVGQTITVEYAYEDPFGQRRRGRGPAMYPAEGQSYKVGAPVRILIDPDRPKESVLA